LAIFLRIKFSPSAISAKLLVLQRPQIQLFNQNEILAIILTTGYSFSNKPLALKAFYLTVYSFALPNLITCLNPDQKIELRRFNYTTVQAGRVRIMGKIAHGS